eukprot:1194781-Prorocentrum_minimum.AAC.6
MSRSPACCSSRSQVAGLPFQNTKNSMACFTVQPLGRLKQPKSSADILQPTYTTTTIAKC